MIIDAADVPPTVLIGAGLSVGVGIEGTDGLTAAVLSGEQPVISSVHYPHGTLGALHLLKRALLARYDKVDFELLLHASETLFTLSQDELTSPDEVKPVYGAFMDASPRWADLVRYGQWPTAANAIIATIVNKLTTRTAEISVSGLAEVTALTSALRRLGKVKWFTLNYDTVLERAGIEPCDGFNGPGDHPMRFDATAFTRAIDAGEEILCHLHGSIRYSADILTPGLLEIVQNQSPEAAHSREMPFVYEHTQSREKYFVTSLIAGLHKSEKVLVQPFNYYQMAFVRSLLASPRIVIIGYGGRDFYINHWLREAARLHRDSLRLAVVLPIDPGNYVLSLMADIEGKKHIEDWLRSCRQEGACYIGQRGFLASNKFPLCTAEIDKLLAFVST